MSPSPWLSYVERLLKSWTAFQLGIILQSGGLETLEKAKWFAEVLSEYTLKKRDLYQSDLLEWMSTILNCDFDLIIKDYSDEWFTSTLLKCCEMYRKQDYVGLNDFIFSLPSEDTVSNALKASNVKISDDEDIESNDVDNIDDDSDNEGNVEKETDAELPKLERTHRTMEVDDDGWTTVVYR